MWVVTATHHTNINYCQSSELNILVGLKWYLTELPSCIFLSSTIDVCVCIFLQVFHSTEIQKMANWFLHVTKAITSKFRRWTWDNQYFHTWTETNPREVCRIREIKQKWARIEYHGALKLPVMYSVPFLSLNCFSEGVNPISFAASATRFFISAAVIPADSIITYSVSDTTSLSGGGEGSGEKGAPCAPAPKKVEGSFALCALQRVGSAL